ncbi:pseudouridine synthase [Fulvivirga sp.]|uniref:pseudouridine synthase n=1 Tax=Fulvivirga sp. TaxID=1931237 RepID=UPI0032EAEEDA
MTKHRHFIIHKPYGYLSQFVHNERRRKNRKLLGELHDFPEGTMSIGRLDQNSEGLLLLTTDGKVSHQVLSKKIEKEYYIQVDGIITDEAIEALKKGVDIALQGEIYETLPCKAFRLDSAPDFPPRAQKIRDARHGPTSWMSVTVNEGKFRQVRKMSAAVGFPTLRLVRVRIGNIHLNDMKSGEVVEVEEFSLT